MEENIKTSVKILRNPFFGEWVPRKDVKAFFGYGSTKMSTFAKDHDIRISRIGKRIFYNIGDISRMLNQNVEKRGRLTR